MSKDERIKDFISVQSKKPKPVYNPFFGFNVVGEYGINGTGRYYQKKILRNRTELSKRSRKKRSYTLEILLNFEKHYS